MNRYLRRTRESIAMAVASTIALRGTCDRKQVGALLTIDGRPISWGYNGAPPGLPHCSENHHGWLGREPLDFWENPPVDPVTKYGCRNATHAEANALAFAARQGISTANATLFVTCSPCDVCARLLIAAGVSEVWYDEEYRDRGGLELLEKAGIECRCMSVY